MSEARKRSVLGRYWPVLVVVLLAGGLMSLGASRNGDDDDSATPTTTALAASTGPPALAAFPGEDPLDAPDCDPRTGRIAVPSLYAPDCVPIWDASRDNGGATYQGVTAKEIKIAVYVARTNAELQAGQEQAIGTALPGQDETSKNRAKVYEAYNALWETYGRKVTYQLLTATGTETDDAAAKADAIRAAEEMGVFAVLGGPSGTKAFAEELVARHVICIGCAEGYPAESYQKWAPYVWGAGMAATSRGTFIEDLIRGLAKKPAEFAGDALQKTTRKFAFVHSDTVDNAYKPASDELIADLGKDDIKLEDHSYVFDIGTAQETAGTLVARMKSDGMTSVILSGDPYMPYFMVIAATSQDWFPEWILTGAGFTDTAVAGRSYDQQQWRHAFGISTLIARVDPKIVDDEAANPVAWYYGEKLSSYPDVIFAGTLFTGIHLAGPNLTPDTFRNGLFAWKPTGGYVTGWAASYGKSIWDQPDYTAADDITLVWWDPDAVGPHEAGVEGKGMYRYVDGGHRFDRGELAKYKPKFFDPAGSVTLLETVPPSDIPPSYPRRTSRTG